MTGVTHLALAVLAGVLAVVTVVAWVWLLRQ
jgi:hypothetical protein